MSDLKRTRRGRMIPALIGCFYLGIAAGWWARAQFDAPPAAAATADDSATVPSDGSPPATTRRPPPPARPAGHPVGTSGDPTAPASTTPADAALASSTLASATPADAVAELRTHRLQLPVDGIAVASLQGQFADRRDSGARAHEAVDMLAPRGTAVRAVEDGTIEKLFTSTAGGLTVYQFDPSGRFCYYYAHLDRYAPGLREKQAIRRGDLIGTVGTSGNAPADTPHLHFAIVRLNADRRWWEGQPLDPYPVFAPAD